MKTTLTIRGTHCNACKTLIEEVAKETPGIQDCTVDFATGKTEILHDKNIDWEKFKKEITGLGDYRVEGV